MVAFAPRRKAKPKIKTAGTGKRVILVFGPPSVGTSTILSCLKAASETPIIVVPYVGPESIVEAEEALNHAEVVFLDVDGGVLGSDDIQALVDHRLIYPDCGAMIRLYAPNEDILARGEERPGHVCEDDLRVWSQSMPPLEDLIRTHTVTYFMIPNVDLEEAIKQLALRSGIVR